MGSFKKYIILLLFQVPFVTYSFPYALGIGMSTGYRFNNSSTYVEENFKNFLLSGEYILNKYQQGGYSFGFNYKLNIVPAPFEVFIGCNFSKLRGGSDGIEWNYQNTDQYTIFSVSNASYLIPSIVVKYNIIAYEKRTDFTRKCKFSLFCRLGYRSYTGHAPTVNYVSGTPYQNGYNEIEKSIRSGIGISAGFAFSFGKKEKKK